MNNFVVHFHDENFVSKVMNVKAESKFAVTDILVQREENDYMQDIDVWLADGVGILNAPTYTLNEFKKIVEDQCAGLHII